jgi:hypothetical protein
MIVLEIVIRLDLPTIGPEFLPQKTQNGRQDFCPGSRTLGCDQQPPKVCAAADEVEALDKISPLAKSISGPPPHVLWLQLDLNRCKRNVQPPWPESYCSAPPT